MKLGSVSEVYTWELLGNHGLEVVLEAEMWKMLK
jgi:hypothetical protein